MKGGLEMADFKELRNKQGLTQAQLADKLDVSVNTVQNWERGRNLPSGENLSKYLKSLGITNQFDITRIAGEISTAAYNEESTDGLGNVPAFLFPTDSQELLSIKKCFASAEELDMLGYVEYVRGNSEYSKCERRGDAKFPLEFAFFEKHGGFNATMKKISEARNRLGSLYKDALEFAEQNPGCEYRLVSFDKSEIINRIYDFLGNRDYKNVLLDLYYSLKTIEAVSNDSFSHSSAEIMVKASKKINSILRDCYGRYWNEEKNLGYLTGYVELNDNGLQGIPTIKNLTFTERGKQFLQWFDNEANIKSIAH